MVAHTFNSGTQKAEAEDLVYITSSGIDGTTKRDPCLKTQKPNQTTTNPWDILSHLRKHSICLYVTDCFFILFITFLQNS